MGKQHTYNVQTTWTGNTGRGTADYRAYARDYELIATGKSASIPGSSDPAFRGDRSRYNPEELLVAALSACHMLSLLHLCADAGIVVTEYSDAASGTMTESADGGGQFARVVLRPKMTISDASRVEEAMRLHERASELCFIARSVNFPVEHEPEVVGRE